MKPGVYEIVNTLNQHRYIGSTVDFDKRWRMHKNQLKKGKHHSIYLQRAWNKYGEDVFQFNIMVIAKGKKYRLLIEQKLLDNYEPKYNLCPTAGSRQGDKSSPETIQKLIDYAKTLSEKEREWRRNNIIENAVPAAIEWHGTEEGLEWHKEHYEDVKHLLHKRRLIVCDQCGKEYMGEKGRFCSNSCKSKWRRESGIDDEIRKCIVCDEEFSVNKYSDTVTCSRSCGRTLGWQQNRQGN